MKIAFAANPIAPYDTNLIEQAGRKLDVSDRFTFQSARVQDQDVQATIREEQMKAWRFYGFNDMRLDQVPEPVCPPRHVIAEVLCGLIEKSVSDALKMVGRR